jgi:hypothetical protein
MVVAPLMTNEIWLLLNHLEIDSMLMVQNCGQGWFGANSAVSTYCEGDGVENFSVIRPRIGLGSAPRASSHFNGLSGIFRKLLKKFYDLVGVLLCDYETIVSMNKQVTNALSLWNYEGATLSCSFQCWQPESDIGLCLKEG